MAVQIEVVKFRDLVPVTNISFASGFDFPTLDIRGEDFGSVDKVLINESPSPEVVVVNAHRIFAQLPSNAQDQISSVEVVSSRFTKTSAASKLTYEFGDKTRTVTGILKLTQLFSKWMLQSPGTDVFNPERGGGLQLLVGQISTSRGMDHVLGSLSLVVQNTATQVRAAQLLQPGLPADERLLTADLVDVNVYEKEMEAHVKVQITSVAGQDAVAALQL